MIAGVDESGEGHDSAAAAIGVAEAVAVRMGTRERQKIILPKEPVGLPGDFPNHVGKGDPLLQALRQNKAAGVSGGLKTNAGDPRPLQPEANDGADFLLVHVGLQGGNQGGTQSVPAQVFDGTALNLRQWFSAQRLIDRIAQAVELQIDLKPMPVAA